MTRTYDNKRIIKPIGLLDVDSAFKSWWEDKLALHYKNKDDESKKVPVLFFTSERWNRAREEGVRNEDGMLITPIIVISRTSISDSTSGPTSRTFAETKSYHTIAKQADKKSSIVQNLLESRPDNIDPNLPLWEMYSIPTPDHFSLTYEVAIWSSYMEEMNDFIQKIGQEFDYKSKKCFKFETPEGFYFVAFKEDEIDDESNLEDFSRSERIIRQQYQFKVSAHLIPETDERRAPMRRYWSQTRLVIKEETALTEEEWKKLIGK